MLGSSGSSPAVSISRNKWLFSSTEMHQTASFIDGISPDEEKSRRRDAAKLVYDFFDTFQQKNNSLLICVAITHMQRFFYYHSFRRFDYRDVVAACVFLTGKSEDSPKKLSTIAHTWLNKKFPPYTAFPDEQHYRQARELIVFLESQLLKTLAFDVNTAVPHSLLLMTVDKYFKPSCTQTFSKCCYYLITELYVVTDWCLRYTVEQIAAASLHIYGVLGDIKLADALHPHMAEKFEQWIGSLLNKDQIRDMTEEFIEIFKILPDLSAYTTLNVLDRKGIYRGLNSSEGSLLPPPPLAPILQPKKLDISTYRERTKDVPTSSNTPDLARKSFLPDFNKLAAERREPNPGAQAPRHSNGHHHGHHHGHHSHQMGPPRSREEEERRQKEKEDRKKEKERAVEMRDQKHRTDERKRDQQFERHISQPVEKRPKIGEEQSNLHHQQQQQHLIHKSMSAPNGFRQPSNHERNSGERTMEKKSQYRLELEKEGIFGGGQQPAAAVKKSDYALAVEKMEQEEKQKSSEILSSPEGLFPPPPMPPPSALLTELEEGELE